MQKALSLKPNTKAAMSKKDVLDTVDIFFGAGKQNTEETAGDKTDTRIPQEIADEIERLEAALPKLQAKAEKIVAARTAKNGGKSAAKTGRAQQETTGTASERPSYPPIAEPELTGSQRGAHPYAGRMPQPRQQQVPEMPERERISFVLPYEQVEFLKNYKYCRALMDGDPQYTLTEALTEAIELLRKHSEYEVFERPDFVRAREKKPRR